MAFRVDELIHAVQLNENANVRQWHSACP